MSLVSTPEQMFTAMALNCLLLQGQPAGSLSSWDSGRDATSMVHSDSEAHVWAELRVKSYSDFGTQEIIDQNAP